MKKRILSIIIISIYAISCISCTDTPGIDPTVSDTSGIPTGTSSALETEPEYIYPELDCGGDEFTILNCAHVWDMYSYLDFEEMTGESLDDAVYQRNRTAEDLFNIKLNIIEFPLDELTTKIQQAVTSGDDTYDVAYARGNKINSTITGGYAMNLFDVDGLQLDMPWWNQSVIDEATIGDRDAVYFALNDLSLSAFDLVWCVFFNEDMMNSLGIEMPYDLVREGKWTISEFNKLLKQGTNLNGDTSFTFNTSGKCIYGLASYYRLVGSMMAGAGVKYTAKNSQGYPVLSLENDRFYSVAEKLASIFGSEGDYVEANTRSEGKHYEGIFKDSRALFIGGEIKSASVFRDMTDNFGILPTPKYDESQEDYCSWMNYDSPTMCIPASNSNPDRTGIILDAMSYLSYSEILPVYYSIRVSQKGLRNDDSIEMLGIIRDSLYYDASLTYGWTLEMFTNFQNKIITGDSDIASIIAASKSGVEEKIKKTIESLE